MRSNDRVGAARLPGSSRARRHGRRRGAPSAVQNSRLKSGPIRSFLSGASQLTDLVQFEGMTFDEAKVEVVLADGSRRTYNVEKLTTGHAFTRYIDEFLEFGDDGDPTRDSLIAALRRALAEKS